MIKKNLKVNGIDRTIVADSRESLAHVLRGQLGLTGTKIGCGQGQCGCCNVILDGKLVRSCITRMAKVPDDVDITTVEGVGKPDDLDPIQQALIVHGGTQCGFCTPGFVVSSKALLSENPNPSREDVREWFQVHRNACRCTGYRQITDAVLDAARVVRGELKAADLEYKMPESGQVWGSRHPRPSAVAKVTGTLDYGADLGLKMPPDTLHLALVQAEVSHAVIRSIDTSEAETMPGVHKVVTHRDIQGKNRVAGLTTFPANLGDGLDRPHPVRREGLSVRRRYCDRLCGYGGPGSGCGGEGPCRARGASGLHERPGGHGRGCHGDSPRDPQHLLRPEGRQG